MLIWPLQCSKVLRLGVHGLAHMAQRFVSSIFLHTIKVSPWHFDKIIFDSEKRGREDDGRIGRQRRGGEVREAEGKRVGQRCRGGGRLGTQR